MTGDEIRLIMARVHGLWPRDRDEESDREWLLVLKPLLVKVADAAVNELRDTLMFPPTVAEFRTAYYHALAVGVDERLALPPGDETPAPLRDRYGENQAEWVYCWRCDMALSLEERTFKELSGYDESRGLYHRKCPKRGSAPTIPSAERLRRDEFFERRKISIGPNVEPLPYRG